jgi:histidinol-phosphate aminotransferase
MTDSKTRYFRDNIAGMQAYVPGEQPQEADYIKLNTNENPYPPAPDVVEKIKAACSADLRLYPDPDALIVRKKLSRIFSVDISQIMLGNGSDELLNIILRSFVGDGQQVHCPAPTYAYYKKLVQLQNARYVEIPFADDYSLPDGLGIEAALTLIANPNSPSGTLADSESLAKVADASEGVLVVDEAYIDFSDGGSIGMLQDHANVVVVRTMSKSFSLAGMRIGMAIASPDLISGLTKVKDHYNMGRLALVAAAAAIDSIDVMRENADRVRQTREYLTLELRQLGMEVWDSSANFVLARVRGADAGMMQQELKRRRILVRHFDEERLKDCLRITVGLRHEIDVLLRELAGILRS